LEGTAASPMVAIGPERMNDRAAHAGMVAESAAGRRRVCSGVALNLECLHEPSVVYCSSGREMHAHRQPRSYFKLPTLPATTPSHTP
jgi:hypothetical protein